jgi:hypothetical protein
MEVDDCIKSLVTKSARESHFLQNAAVEGVNPVDVGMSFEQGHQRPLENNVYLRAGETMSQRA